MYNYGVPNRGDWNLWTVKLNLSKNCMFLRNNTSGWGIIMEKQDTDSGARRTRTVDTDKSVQACSHEYHDDWGEPY